MERATWRCVIYPALATALSVLAGCGDAQSGKTEPSSTSAEPLFSSDFFRLWPGHAAKVCWDGTAATDPALATFRSNARAWVEQHIARVTDFRFTAWGTCPTFTWDEASGRFLNGENTIAVKVDGSWIGPLGGQPYPPAPELNDGYQSNGPTLVVFVPDNTLNGGDQGLVLHEFMHAIGFNHDFDRYDNFPDVKCHLGVAADGTTYGTPVDPISITNYSYCDGPGNTLSPWDIVGLQNAYGRKPAGSIVGPNDNCILTPSVAGGTWIRTGTCIGSDSDFVEAAQRERWRRDNNGKLSLATSSSTLMTAISGGLVRVQSPGTSWNFNTMEVRGIGDKCVAPAGGSLVSGAVLEITTCNGSNTQQWQVSTNGTIATFSNGSLCWDVTGGSTATHTAIQLASCNGAANQTFTLLTEGGLTFGGQCLDSTWGVPTDGETLQLYPCKANSDPSRHNQRYYLNGPISSSTGCLSFVGGGSVLSHVACNGSTAQKWDYHFWVQ